ncbi:VanZ family protein [Sulfurimonas diazotrophicus]|uniref:VanZ family protein n=1 Tax=Sulfurimonas diazotrophicus TaxID=3131939 RepID=A0ABZ3HC04_9BACT
MNAAKLLFAVTLLAVTLLAFIPTYEPLPEIVSFSDILNHFAAFFTLYMLHLFAYPAFSWRRRSALLLGYGVLIEAVQAFLPNRYASLSDVAVDAAALTAAMLLHLLVYRLRARRA